MSHQRKFSRWIYGKSARPTTSSGASRASSEHPHLAPQHASLDLSHIAPERVDIEFRYEAHGCPQPHEQVSSSSSQQPSPLHSDPENIHCNPYSPTSSQPPLFHSDPEIILSIPNIMETETESSPIIRKSNWKLDPPRFRHKRVQILENLILNPNYQPIDSGSLVKERHLRSMLGSIKLNTPKYIQTAAMCTFAVSVGFSLGNDIYIFPGGTEVLLEGTGVAIDDHHILSSAHIFEWPVDQLGPAPKGLKYRIHVCHDHKIPLSRLRMLTLPDPDVDFEVNIAAWADGAPMDQIREVNNTHVALNNDLVLLNSPKKLTRLECFPVPHRFHTPPNNAAATARQDKLIMLAYNGFPNMAEEYLRYPKTTRNMIAEAVKRLHPDALSWSEGFSESGVFDADVVFYRISTYCGASGSGVFDDKGRLVAIHSRGEEKTNLDGSKYVDPTCLNKGVALDGTVASNFIKTVVGPRLRKDIGVHWVNF